MNNPVSMSLKTLQIIHTALGAGVLFLLTLSIVLGVFMPGTPAVGSGIIFFSYGAFVLTLIVIAPAKIIFNQMLTVMKVKYPDWSEERYKIYLQPHIVRMAMLEGVALIAGVALLLRSQTGGPLGTDMAAILPLVAIGIFIAQWVVLFPTDYKIEEDIGILR